MAAPKVPDMAKPKPPVDERKMRCTVSVANKLVAASDTVRAEQPEQNLKDFSDVVSRALYQYLERLSTGVVARAAANLRTNYTSEERQALKVAEARPLHAPAAEKLSQFASDLLRKPGPKRPDPSRAQRK